MSGTTSFEPRTGSVAGTIAETTKEALTRILEQARSAAPQLAASPPTERSAWLYAIAEALEQHVDELVEIADRETALGEQRLTGEVARAAGQLRFYADVAAEGSYLDVTIDDATVTSPRLVRINRPIGPVAVFGASNFPFAFGLLGNDTASAIAAGCPVIAKAHPAMSCSVNASPNSQRPPSPPLARRTARSRWSLGMRPGRAWRRPMLLPQLPLPVHRAVGWRCGEWPTTVRR